MPEHASATYFDKIARTDARPRRIQAGFHRQITQLHRRIIPPASSVLEWGCGKGDLLRALAPSRGLGLDYSGYMIADAKARTSSTTQQSVYVSFVQPTFKPSK